MTESPSVVPSPDPSLAALGGKIVGLGEALFDCFEDHQTLGGAPLNAAFIAQTLGQPFGIRSQMVSRVGSDELGNQVMAALQHRGLDTSTLQRDPERPTGTVKVELVDGDPQYEIITNVAWDYLTWDQRLADLAKQAAGVTFGTLAQRNSVSRRTIQQFLEQATSAVRLFDVNLRQHFYNREVIEKSCQLAHVIKLNNEELSTVCNLLDLPSDEQKSSSCPQQLMKAYSLRAVILTHGSRGTELITPQGSFTGEVPRFPAEPGSDPVGAGDACGATCLLGLILGWDPQTIVDRANRVGAYVASRSGATPDLTNVRTELLG